jgi:type II secretory pathway component PulC
LITLLLSSLAQADGPSAEIGPRFAGQKIKGFTFEKIAQESEWEKMGLKNGDVILSINGVPTPTYGTSTPDFVSALQKRGRLRLVIERDGKRKTLSYRK